MLKITYSDKALFDLEEIYNFIRKDNDFYANKVVDSITWQIWWLISAFPKIWKQITSNWLRESVESSFRYRIFYKIYNDRIRIISISKYKDKLL